MNKRGRRLIPFTITIIIALIACGPFPSTATEPVVVDTPSLGQIQTNVAETISALSVGQPTLEVTTGAQAAPSNTPIVPTIPAGPTKTATDSQSCDKVQFVSETITDGTDFAPSATFTKTWRVRNVGTCTWDSSYDIVFDHGSTLGAPAAVAFPGVVAPGQEVDLSVNMTAPDSAGTYASYWKFRNGSDVIFVANPFSTVIDVIAPTATSGVGIIITLVPGPLLLLRYTSQYWQQTSIPASSQGSIKADCPSGSVVTAGGFATSGSNMFVKTMSKDANGWQVYGVNQLGSSQLLNSYVTCLFNSGGTSSQVYNQVTVAGNSNGHATVSCPAGSVVTGGGYASNDKFTVYNSSKDGNGWQTWAHNNSGSNQLLNAYAICLSGTTAATSQVLTSGSIPAGSTKGIESKCPSGSLVTGGGFAVSPDLLIYNTSMNAGGDGWETYARNPTGSSMTLYSYVMCLTFP